MSAAVAWDVAGSGRGAFAPTRTATPASRPRLALVPPLAPARPARLRITRAGRLALTLTVALALAAVVAAGALRSGAPAGVQGHEITVFAGQTLSEIAAAQLPDVPVKQAVVELRMVNNLPSDQIIAGQRLLIPAA